MDLQNLAYALIQVAHNFGAATVVAVPLYALVATRTAGARGLRWLALAGWGVQLASGALFGLVSLHFYGQLPDIHGIAIGALALKLLCAALAVLLLAWAPYRCIGAAWRVLAVLGMVALSAAAFLRWFS